MGLIGGVLFLDELLEELNVLFQGSLVTGRCIPPADGKEVVGGLCEVDLPRARSRGIVVARGVPGSDCF